MTIKKRKFYVCDVCGMLEEEDTRPAAWSEYHFIQGGPAGNLRTIHLCGLKKHYNITTGELLFAMTKREPEFKDMVDQFCAEEALKVEA